MDELIQNLKRAGVLQSPFVTAAFHAIDRRDFVPAEHQHEAYGDYPLPIGGGQTISQPFTVAFLLDLLDPRPGETILDIGAGSGWQATLLAHVVSQEEGQESPHQNKFGAGQAKVKSQKSGKVYAIERIPELCRLARANISKYGFIQQGTAELHCGDATGGLPDAAPFDKIIAAASASEIPVAWKQQLKTGGVMVAPIQASIWRYRKLGPDEWKAEEFPGFAFVPLVTKEARSGERGAGSGRMRSLVGIFLAVAALLGIFLALPKTIPPDSAEIKILPGTGSRAIGDLLKTQGIIRSKWAFVTYAALTGKASDLKPGIYALERRVTIPGLVSLLARGEPYPNERFITIPEGWDLRDISAYFEKNSIASSRELYAVTGEPARRYPPGVRFPPPELMKSLPAVLTERPAAASLEGYLYPDTYRVFRNASAADIVQKMLENLDKKLRPELRQEIRRQERSIADVITVASLVEKEVPGTAERRIVAGILWKRLELGIPLQVDATVNYITGKRETPSAADLAIDSPYNTYRSRGLPPGPIANPGIEAVETTIYSEPSDYRYYLSGRDGETIFSRTLPEHAAARAKYLK